MSKTWSGRWRRHAGAQLRDASANTPCVLQTALAEATRMSATLAGPRILIKRTTKPRCRSGGLTRKLESWVRGSRGSRAIRPLRRRWRPPPRHSSHLHHRRLRRPRRRPRTGLWRADRCTARGEPPARPRASPDHYPVDTARVAATMIDQIRTESREAIDRGLPACWHYSLTAKELRLPR